jgi:AraC-like DNA-binding protein
MGAFQPPGKRNDTNPSSNGESARTTWGSVTKDHVKLEALVPALLDGRLRKVLQMIESDQPHKIHDLALECRLSQSHLQHLFKERTGLGLGRLLTEQRMQRAIDFLVHTNMSIKEIAYIVGYEHTSSFTRAFERQFHLAPSSYRQIQISYKQSAKTP